MSKTTIQCNSSSSSRRKSDSSARGSAMVFQAPPFTARRAVTNIAQAVFLQHLEAMNAESDQGQAVVGLAHPSAGSVNTDRLEQVLPRGRAAIMRVVSQFV